jgi:hypothetical protein
MPFAAKGIDLSEQQMARRFLQTLCVIAAWRALMNLHPAAAI